MDTKVYIRYENNLVDLNELANESHKRAIPGQLVLQSSIRSCYINDEQPANEFVDTRDNIIFYCGKIYYRGRDDRKVKINGKITDLNYLEQVRISIFFNFKSNCFS
jgi:hypothetical protein